MVVMTALIEFSDASVLITGGGEGIGRGLAARFLGAGSTVLITGRNPEKLDRAARELPGLKTFVNDIGKAEEREKLAACVRETIPALNIVVNNAGNQRRVSLAADKAPWAERQSEIDTLLCGPVHLNHLLVPTILSHGRPSMIVNVTSGGAYVPQPFAPIYSACKAALHSYTVNLRFALANTACRVVEIIPPAVRTALAGPGATHGAPLDEFCDAVFLGLSESDTAEIGFGVTAGEAFNEPKRLYRALFEQFSPRFPVERYS
jgi:uncharacterized oxidoreductase